MERMTGLEPMSWPWRGLALPAELHPQRCKACLRPVPRLPCGNLLRSVHRERWCDRIDRWTAPLRRPVELRSERGPDPFGVRASAYRESKVRCYALPSPGCIRPSLRSSCTDATEARGWIAGWAGCRVAPQVPSDSIAAARANATRPFMGRLVLTALREVTVSPWEMERLAAQVLEQVRIRRGGL